jgi:hypothetical protein
VQRGRFVEVAGDEDGFPAEIKSSASVRGIVGVVQSGPEIRIPLSKRVDQELATRSIFASMGWDFPKATNTARILFFTAT